MVSSFRDLIVWQKAMQLATELYRITDRFPAGEQYCLTTQLRRAAISVPSNIAEGFGRESRREFQQFLRIARGSVFELQTQIELAARLNYTAMDDSSHLDATAEEIRRILTALIKSLAYSRPDKRT